MSENEEREYVWDKEIAVPVRLIQYFDQGVRELLPPGTKFHGISPSGASYWARTANIDAADEAGEETPFFIKVHHGREMAVSEFEAMKKLYVVMPELIAEPLGFGEYKEEEGVSFFVCRYYELSGDIPDVSDFPALLADMHRRPAGVSETGEFGLDLVTYGGRNPHHFPVAKTWEQCFAGGLALTFNMEEETHGPDPELAELREGIMTKVIPRLLRPLETEGRTIKPVLVHGDIWDGNASVNVNTRQPVIFDPTPLYAHNEYEMAPWWASRHKMTSTYIAEYIKHHPVSEPTEDFKDRGALYGLRFDLHASSLYLGNLRFRKIAMKTMRDLLHKYPLGYEGYRVEKGLPLAHDGEKAEVLEPQGSPSGCSPMVQVYGFHDRASPLVPASGPAVSTQR